MTMVIYEVTIMPAKNHIPKKSGHKAVPAPVFTQVAVGEFKAKCLGMMREVATTGTPILITLRGKPLVEVAPPRHHKAKGRDKFIGRLEGVIKINGDPGDLVKPVFPLKDWVMVK